MPGWRAMQAEDLDRAKSISDRVHGPAYTEDRAIFAERLALFPEGCFVLEQDGAVAGYWISHPWKSGTTPPLNALIRQLPSDPDCFYLHDIAIAPEARGTGAGKTAIGHITELARKLGFPELWLTSVGGADHYWQRMGFERISSGSYGAGSHLMLRPIGAN